MDKKELKKILAGISLAGLIAGGALLATGCATDGKSS
jgi:radical SAM modification target selenobiotic family peptide